MAANIYTKTLQVEGETWTVEVNEEEGFDTVISAQADAMRWIAETEISDSSDEAIRKAIVDGFYNYDPTP